MDAVRFTSGKRTDQQRDDFKAWLVANGRIAKLLPNGSPDPSDCTLTGDPNSFGPDADLSITRDEVAMQIGYASPVFSSGSEPTTYKRHVLQLDHPPTPFPESLAEWLVTV